MNVYKLYCQRRGWCYASADRDEDNDDNFDRNKRAVRVSRTLTVNGIGAYGDFQYEAGVHRFIRKLHLSVQTSSLLVIVIPQADPIQSIAHSFRQNRLKMVSSIVFKFVCCFDYR